MYYAGLDAILKYVTLAVVDRAGAVVLETTVPTREPERLCAVLRPYRPLDVVVETCPFWPWLYDLLVPAGISFHPAHTKRLRAIATAPQKNGCGGRSPSRPHATRGVDRAGGSADLVESRHNESPMRVGTRRDAISQPATRAAASRFPVGVK